jgi:hypothetical protein
MSSIISSGNREVLQFHSAYTRAAPAIEIKGASMIDLRIIFSTEESVSIYKHNCS